MASSKEIVKQFSEKLVKDLQKSTPKATGKTAKSIHAVQTKTGFIIFGGEQIGALIDGRKPTSSGATKGNPTLQEQIFDWIKARSISPRESDMTQLQLSWAMSNSIHKKGYKGEPDLFASILNPNRFDSLTKTLISNKALSIQSSLVKQFKQ